MSNKCHIFHRKTRTYFFPDEMREKVTVGNPGQPEVEGDPEEGRRRRRSSRSQAEARQAFRRRNRLFRDRIGDKADNGDIQEYVAANGVNLDPVADNGDILEHVAANGDGVKRTTSYRDKTDRMADKKTAFRYQDLVTNGEDLTTAWAKDEGVKNGNIFYTDASSLPLPLGM